MLTHDQAVAISSLPRQGPIAQVQRIQGFLSETAQILRDSLKDETDTRMKAVVAASLARVAQSHDGCVHRVRLLRGQPWVGTAKPAPQKPKRSKAKSSEPVEPEPSAKP